MVTRVLYWGWVTSRVSWATTELLLERKQRYFWAAYQPGISSALTPHML